LEGMTRARCPLPLIPSPSAAIPRLMRSAADALVTALLAPACAVCDAILDQPLSGCVCESCWAAIRRVTPPLCDACGDPLAGRVEGLCHDAPSIAGSRPCCRQCTGRHRVLDRARAVGGYEGALREIIHALKYGGRRSLAGPLGRRMRLCGLDLLDAADAVVPVPLHWRRKYRRGFNQAHELARHLGPPVIDVLVRTRHTRPQVELAAAQRRSNVEGSFGLRRRVLWRRRSIEGLRLVLVDDVTTTGATMEACGRVLKEGGASEVYALTAARA
jgi:ComF family protein